MEVQFIDREPDDERLAAVIAISLQSYLESSNKDQIGPIQSMSRWTIAGRREAHGVRRSQGQSRSHWGSNVS
jgi:hypothetical protein